MRYLIFFYFSVVFILLIYSKEVKSAECESITDRRSNIKINNIGAIVDLSSRKGKEEKVAMEIAIHDFYKNYTNSRSSLALHIKGDYISSQNNIASFAMDLIDEKRVGAIVGGWKWDETATVAELGNKYQVPVLSLSKGVPYWASQKWTFLIQAVQRQYLQTRAVAAIVGSWKWSRVNIIYEEDISSATNIVPHLVDALREVDCKIDHLLPLPSVNLAYSSSLFTKELEKLKRGHSRVFIVHSSLQVASHLFMVAKNMGLMEKDSVWITTNALTNLLDSVNRSTISSMQGVLGVMSYFPKGGEKFNEFSSTFQNRFHLEFPDEVNLEPGIFAIQAYDALWTVALAMEQRRTDKKIMRNSPNDKMLLERILVSNFMGLTGQFRFKERGRLDAAHIFQIVNVVGKSYRELGFWSKGLGFSENISEGEEEVTHNKSMKIFGNVFWPGGPHSVPRGWVLLKTDMPLKIGVPAKPTFDQFVNVKYDNPGGKVSVDGLSIDVFKAVHQNLQYQFPYQFVPYIGTYDSLVKQIHLKTFDAVIGDTSIVADRCEYAEFSQPWTDTGLQMVVFNKSKNSKKAWLFMKPFTKAMWGVTAGINIYNGFVVWLIERMHKPHFRGSASTQVGILIWLSFTTLFSLQGDGMHSNLSRMTMVAWLFVALVITQSYTANLSSMLTVPQLESSWVSVESLKQSNAKVGCDGGSFVVKYLVDVLDFNPDNIRTITSADQYPEALKRGEIKAAFLVVPFVQVFLAKYCKDFAVVGPTYNIGGFGFAFPKGSPLLPGISKSILQLAESGKLLELQNAMLSSYNCSRSDDDHASLGVTSYWGLFVFTGGTSTVALVLFIIHSIFNRSPSHDPLIHGTEETETENEDHEQMVQSNNDLIPEGTEEHQVHNPDFDELWMFAPEMHG